MKEEEGYNDTNRKSIYVMYKIYTKTKINKGFLIFRRASRQNDFFSTSDHVLDFDGPKLLMIVYF